MAFPRRLSTLAAPAALAALTLWLAFSAGGYFPGATAVAAIACGLALALWLVLARRPLAGLSPALAVAVAGLAAYAAVALISQAWSGAPGRALLDADRTLLYALVVAAVGLAGARPAVRANLPRFVAGALAAIAACGLITRLLPSLWPIARDVEFERLSYPLTYWNAMALLCVLAVIACLHLACSAREHPVVRALAAAAIPIAATAVLFTFSRGPIALAPLGILVYLALARPRGAPAALVAIVPTTAIALGVAYGANAVIEQTAPTAAGIHQGWIVAAVVVACAALAGGLLLALRPLDARVARWRVPRPRRPWAWVAGLAALLVVAAIAVDLPGRVADQAHRLDRVSRVDETGDSRARLTQLADNGRVDNWSVALHAFTASPLHGSGAGTYALTWQRDRSIDQDVTDAHSLYLQALAEVGLLGALPLIAAILALLVGTAARARGPDRAQGAVAFAVLLTWAVHAGIDWDWQVPALTLPVLALAAGIAARPAAAPAAAAAPARAPVPSWRGWALRAVAAAALAGLLLTPLALARSQSRLDGALAALGRGDCTAAAAGAEHALAATTARPEPYLVLGVCAAREGRPAAALTWMRAALERDPQSWRLHYDVAVTRALRGLDPRADLLAAHRRNPRSWVVIQARERFATTSAGAWRAQARAAVLLV